MATILYPTPQPADDILPGATFCKLRDQKGEPEQKCVTVTVPPGVYNATYWNGREQQPAVAQVTLTQPTTYNVYVWNLDETPPSTGLYLVVDGREQKLRDHEVVSVVAYRFIDKDSYPDVVDTIAIHALKQAGWLA